MNDNDQILARCERLVPVDAYDVVRADGGHALDSAAGDAPLSEFARRCIAWNRAHPVEVTLAIRGHIGDNYCVGCADAADAADPCGESVFGIAYDAAAGPQPRSEQTEPVGSFLDRFPDARRNTCLWLVSIQIPE
jgi:hypothetical protein